MNQLISLVFCTIGLFLVVSGGQLSSQYLPPHQSFGGFSGSSGSYGGGPRVPINRYDNTNDGDGNYNYNYETGNGISVQEQGRLQNRGSSNEAETVHGSYSYTAPDGQRISVSYTADENGFHPVGAHLPTPPPIPEAILKSLEFNRREGYRGDDDGQYQQGYRY